MRRSSSRARRARAPSASQCWPRSNAGCCRDPAYAPPVNKLYVVHSSHPSEAVKKALACKGIPFKTVELLIPTQLLLVRLMRFPVRSVPALKLDGGEKVQ